MLQQDSAALSATFRLPTESALLDDAAATRAAAYTLTPDWALQGTPPGIWLSTGVFLFADGEVQTLFPPPKIAYPHPGEVLIGGRT